MAETLTAPAPAPEDQSGRPEKTPAEVNAQIGRITDMLMKRTAKLEYRQQTGTDHRGQPAYNEKDLTTRKREIFGGSTDDKNYLTKSIITDKTEDGKRKFVISRKQETGRAGAGFTSYKGSNELSYTEQDVHGTGKKQVRLEFDDDGSKGSYTTGDPNFVETNTRQLPTESHADTAAKILMKMRGDIVQHELSQPEVAQAEVNELLK